MSQTAKSNKKKNVRAKTSNTAKTKINAKCKNVSRIGQDSKPKTTSVSNTRILPDGAIVSAKTITKKSPNSFAQIQKYEATSSSGNTRGISFIKEEVSDRGKMFQRAEKAVFTKISDIQASSNPTKKETRYKGGCGCL